MSSEPLPQPRTRFIGQRDVLERVYGLLHDHRLVTLTGVGGVGKTRIALRVADRAESELADEIRWVELASLEDPRLLTEAVCSALGTPVAADVSPRDALLHRLRSASSLIVLDNCEHVVDACAELAAELLERCPHIRILATSREVLGVHGELTARVPALSVPESLPTGEGAVGRALDHGSVRLLVDRIRLSRPEFEPTESDVPALVGICRRLEGIPLALELAAARARSLSVEQICERLDEGLGLLRDPGHRPSSRHRTMRAAIDWSYTLLADEERMFLRRLAVFGGGASLEACTAVCAEGESTNTEALELLSGLVDKSLVAVDRDEDAVRYSLLEPLRKFVREKLEEAGELADARRRHAAYFLAFAESTSRDLRTPDRPTALHRFEVEHENVRRAWIAAKEAGDFDIVGRLARVLFWFWNFGGHFSEGRARSEEALAVCPEQSDARIDLLYSAATLAWMQGDYHEALPRLEECASLCRERNRSGFLPVVLREQAGVRLSMGDLREAAALYEESIAGLRSSGAVWDLGLATVMLADVRTALGQIAEAEGMLDDARTLFHEVGDPWGTSLAKFSRAVSAGKAGDLDDARLHASEAVELQRACGDLWNIGMTLTFLGEVTARTGPVERAAAHLVEGIDALRAVGDRASIAHALLCLADLERERGRTLRAVGLAGAGRALSETTEAVHPYTLATEDQRAETVDALRRSAGEEAFAEAWARGRAMTLEEAVAFAEERSGTRPSSVSEAAGAEVALRVLLLGPPVVYRGRRRLRAADWGYALPRELFFYLLLNGPRTKEQIGLEFWPEASVDQLRGRLSTTLYHLRRALGGTEWVRYEDGRYDFDREADYWCDVEAFDSRIERADAMLETDPGAAAAELESAVDLYRGEFLEGASAGRWASERRQAVRRRYLDALVTLGRLKSSEGEHGAAARLHRRALACDELHGRAHRELARCLARAGDRTGALRRLDRFADLLREELDARPSDEVLELRSRLERGERV